MYIYAHLVLTNGRCYSIVIMLIYLFPALSFAGKHVEKCRIWETRLPGFFWLLSKILIIMVVISIS